jgi:hypothetical protein
MMLSYIKKEAQSGSEDSSLGDSTVDRELGADAIMALDRRLEIAESSIAAGISDGNSEFSSAVGFRFKGLFDMLAHGIDKPDNIEAAFRLSFARLNASISKVKSKLLPFTRVISEISVLKSAAEKADILNDLLPEFGNLTEAEPGDNETKILEDEYYASSNRIAFFKSRVVPIFNDKWAAVVGASGGGMSRELYSTIIGWSTLATAMGRMGTSDPTPVTPGTVIEQGKERPNPNTPSEVPDGTADISAISGASISRIFPNPETPYSTSLVSGGVSIETDTLVIGDPLSVVIEVVVADVVAANALEAKDVFYEFIRSSMITINETVLRPTAQNIENLFTASTSISPSKTLFLRIAINVELLKNTMPPAGGSVMLKVKTDGGQKSVLAKNLLYEKLIKLSSGTSTTPLYETTDNNGNTVTFTPAQLVAGGGKIRGAGGKSFRPRRWKGRSLADTVMSKGFGRKK